MKLDLSGLLNGTLSSLTVKESLKVDFEDDEIYLAGPIDLDIDFFMAGDLVIGKGRVRAGLSQRCYILMKDIPSGESTFGDCHRIRVQRKLFFDSAGYCPGRANIQSP